MTWQTSSTGSADTEKLGELLGNNLAGGEVIELRSDLGGGKTTFVRGLARGAGSRDRVSSPTFTLNRVYKVKNFDIYHFDFYRLDDAGILREQLAEAISDRRVVIVEWSDIVQDVLPDDRLVIRFEPKPAGPDERQLTISYTDKYRPLIEKLETAWVEVEP
jgi:tRNA threonylcarbamoyladenosine biosynthesis protein TsaE